MTSTLLFNGIPTCPFCQQPIRWMGIEENEKGEEVDVYKCGCGLCDEEKPIIKNKHD